MKEIAEHPDLIAAQWIRASDIDAFGTTEINSGGVAEALPLYRDITLNGPGVIVCGSATAGTYNKIGNRRFLKFSLANAGSITIRVTSSGAGIPAPDPDFWLFGNGPAAGFGGGDAQRQSRAPSAFLRADM